MKKLLSIAFIGTLLLGVGLSIKKEEKLKSAFDVEIGAVSYYHAERVLKEFKDAEISNRNDKVIDVAINSGGGGVHIGLEFVEEMKAIKAKGYKINCYVRNAYSMGFIILQYCDKRIGSENSTYMHHLVQVGYGRPERTEKNKKLFKALDFFDKLVLNEISKKMKVDPKKFFEIYKDDKWWNAKDALKANIIDEIRPFSLFKKEIKFRFVPFWRRY
jgi:ATP-dependent protease ClpP protease subunit